MANKRQKKKKNSQASRQAAAAYKGKNAVAKPAAPKKQPEKTEQKTVAPQKPEPHKQAEKPVSTPPQKAAVEKKPQAVKQKKNNKKKNSTKDIRRNIKKKFSSLDVKKVSTVILTLSIIIAVISVVALLMSLRFTVPDEAIVEYKGRNLPDSYSVLVTDDLVTQYELTDKMERKGDTKKFRYYAAKSIVFPEKYSTATLNLVNVFDNECVLIASVVDEGGTVIYQSLGLQAGRCLSDITVTKLPYGTHEMKLVVAAYDPESYKLIGVQYSDLSVQVGIEKEVTDEKTQER